MKQPKTYQDEQGKGGRGEKSSLSQPNWTYQGNDDGGWKACNCAVEIDVGDMWQSRRPWKKTEDPVDNCGDHGDRFHSGLDFVALVTEQSGLEMICAGQKGYDCRRARTHQE